MRRKEKQVETQKQLDKRRQSIRVLIFPKKKYARVVFVPIRTQLRQQTLHKVFENRCKYNRANREGTTPKMRERLSAGVFSPRYIEMTVLKEDADQRSLDILDIIFELEGRKRHAEVS